MYSGDTIVAPATAAGTGAIAVIRVSGAEAISLAGSLVKLKRGQLRDAKGYSAHFGTVYTAAGEPIDDVIVTVFRAPRSYTGEDAAEISCHASPYIVSELIRRFADAGARIAEPGEFTRRAFLNGKMDLAQAEAVADVIAASSAASHRVAFSQLRGGVSAELESLRAELLQMTSLLELELDFSEEDVEFADRSALKELVGSALSRIRRLTGSFRLGNALKNGVPVVIAGAANTGKSTLLNALAGEERAIVSEIPGTTRDTIEETVNLGGILFRFIDTAGIRSTDEAVEKIGIGRTFQTLAKADIILALLDAAADGPLLLHQLHTLLSAADFTSQRMIVAVNKIDLISEAECNKIVTLINNHVSTIDNPISILPISAKTGQGLEAVYQQLADIERGRISRAGSCLITNFRHYEALGHAGEALEKVHAALGSALPADLLAEDLRIALSELGRITGAAITPDEVLGHIFQNFCIGK